MCRKFKQNTYNLVRHIRTKFMSEKSGGFHLKKYLKTYLLRNKLYQSQERQCVSTNYFFLLNAKNIVYSINQWPKTKT